MKTLLLSAALLSGASAFADELPEQIFAMPVQSAACQIVPSNYPIGVVKADVYISAVFSNACHAALISEMTTIVIPTMEETDIAVGFKSERICTQEYNPVTRTYKVAQLSLAISGSQPSVTVNGIKTDCTPD